MMKNYGKGRMFFEIIILAGVLSGCGKTGFHLSYKDLNVYHSEAELQEAQVKRLAEKLVEEGSIEKESDLWFVNAYQRDVEYSYAHFHDYTYKFASKEDVCYPYEIYCMSVSDEGDITYYYTLLDYYESMISDDGETERVIYAGNEQDEEITEVRDLATALKLDCPFMDEIWGDPDPRIGWRNYPSGMNWYRAFEHIWSEDRINKLTDPVTAVEELYHLKGGTGTVVGDCDLDVYGLPDIQIVDYQFANGEEVTYCLYETKSGYWKPAYCTQKDDEMYPELQGITDYEARHQKICECASANITLQDLSYKKYDLYFPPTEYSNFLDVRGCISLLHTLPEEDADLHGLFGGQGVVLRVGENVYPMDLEWSSMPYEHGFYCADYDGDGEKEYLYQRLTLSGTGVEVENFCVIEVGPGSSKYVWFERGDFMSLLKGVMPQNAYLGSILDYDIWGKSITFEYNVVTGPTEYVGKITGTIRYLPDGTFQMYDPVYTSFND